MIQANDPFEMDALKTKVANQDLTIGELRAENQSLRDQLAILKHEQVKPETKEMIVEKVVKVPFAVDRLVTKHVPVQVEKIKTVNVPVDRIVEKEVIRVVKEIDPDTESIKKLERLQAKYDTLETQFNKLIARVSDANN